MQELEGTRNTKPKEERNNNNEKWADRDRRASRTEAPDQEESDCENEESDPETTTPAEAVALRPEKNFKESKSDSVKVNKALPLEVVFVGCAERPYAVVKRMFTNQKVYLSSLPHPVMYRYVSSTPSQLKPLQHWYDGQASFLS